MPKTDTTAPEYIDQAECISRLGDEVARLKVLLDGRDDFIVSKGLWLEFRTYMENMP